MLSRSNRIQDSIWLRELQENNMRRVTLRRNFTEETSIQDGVEETQFVFEEANVLIYERDNMQNFIETNFGNLFDLGLIQMQEKDIQKQNESDTKKLLNDGKLANELQVLGQQITNIMLGVA